MKVRVKFRKFGCMKFIGHLDVMRYFQKAIRRAEIDICYTEGFSPHMIMSFASPLGVGLTSDGEYFDIEIRGSISSGEAVRRLNAVMVEGMEVVSFRQIGEEKNQNAMSLVAAADYEVRFREGYAPGFDWQTALNAFAERAHMVIVKKTKKSEKEVDIRPMIYKLQAEDGVIFMQLATGSAENLKPELVMEAFAAEQGITLSEFALLVHRKEVYANQGTEEARRLVTLEDLGADIGK